MLPIALQLYSIREQAAADLAGTLKAVADMGYDGVEFAGFYDHPASEIKKMVADTGLTPIASHTRYEAMHSELGRVIDDHLTLGCSYLIVPYLGEEHRGTPDACRKIGEEFTGLVEKLAGDDLYTGYHAHWGDMHPIEGKLSAWDLIARNTPDAFVLQYDTANGMQGGADPVDPILAYPGRGVLTHLKEYVGKPAAVDASAKTSHAGHGQAAIGDGDVPWPKVFDACERVAGTKWYIVEQEGHPTLNPMDAARLCVTNLRRMLEER